MPLGYVVYRLHSQLPWQHAVADICKCLVLTLRRALDRGRRTSGWGPF